MQLDGPGLAPLSGGKTASWWFSAWGRRNGNDLLILLARGRSFCRRLIHRPHAPFRGVIMRQMAGNGSGLQDRAPGKAARGLRDAQPFSIAFSMNCWPAAGSTSPSWRSPDSRKAPRPALYAGLHRQKQIAGIVALFRRPAWGMALQSEIASKPPVLLVPWRGGHMSCRFQSMAAAKAMLEAVGVPSSAWQGLALPCYSMTRE